MRYKKIVLLGGWIAICCLLVSCSSDNSTENQSPRITAVEPALVCAQQDEIQIDIKGEHLASEITDATQDIETLPVVTLIQTADLSGSPLQQTVTTLVPLASIKQAGPTSVVVGLSSSLNLASGIYRVSLKNPAGKLTNLDDALTIVPAPIVEQLEPGLVCQGLAMSITGTGFIKVGNALPVVLIGNMSYPLDNVTGCTPFTHTGSVFESCTHIGLQLPAELLVTGWQDVSVRNPVSVGCGHTLDNAVEVATSPNVYFVDPPVVYNAINLQVTLHSSGIASTPQEVRIFPTGQPGQATSLLFNSDDQDRIHAVLPAGLAAGQYDILIEDELGCTGGLTNGIQVVEELTVAIESLELPFGWTEERTGVNIYSPEDPGLLSQFKPTPRFYLNPSQAGSDTLASELKHTAYVADTRASATVPAGLLPGWYDLIVQNPDGGIGLLQNAFRVTELPPPIITDIAPASVENQDIQTITILGAHFRSPVIEASCLQPDNITIVITGSLEPDFSNDKSLLVKIDFTDQPVAHRSICLVKVTNEDNDTYSVYSALGVTNPSLNLANFTAASEMNTPRRAACAVTGEATPGARFIYALGGDLGVTLDSMEEPALIYHDSLEMAAVDPFGALGEWNMLGYSLPEARSFLACIGIGRYVYVAGGNGGLGAQNTVWRAKILDPVEAPEITDVLLEVHPADSSTLASGLYLYRVSAVPTEDNLDNPSGETLAGDPILIQVPDIQQKISVSISWTQVDSAAGYRIYRTAGPDQASGQEVLLAEVDPEPRVYTDDGTDTPGTAHTLPLGALGRFAVLPSLITPREGAGIAAAIDPADSSIQYIYLMGGRDETSTCLDDVERLKIQVMPDGSQLVDDSWLPGSVSIGAPRWQLGTFTADRLSASLLVDENETWIYAGGGYQADLLAKQNDVVALRVAAGGALGEDPETWYQVTGLQPFNAGYASFLFNHQLFVFGGNQGEGTDPSNESFSVEMCGLRPGSCSNDIPDPPDIANWNNVGINLGVARYLHAGLTASAFVFLLGGVSADEMGQAFVTASTAKTLW